MAVRNVPLHVEVVTADRALYDGEADLVSAPGIEGRLGILPHHAALLTVLNPGELTIRLGDAEEAIFVSGGFLEVSDNRVTILADAAEHAEEIDQARAEEARRRAQERLAQAQSNRERAEFEAALRRAINRLRVAEVASRRTRRRINRPVEE
jgi:F-type H+-transporting ATPase subunit epsilon